MMRRMMPYGYEIRDGEYVISEQMAENVRTIYQLYLNGLSYAKISEMLAATRDGIQWNKHRVKRILEDRRYVGDETWPAVIQLEQYERVQKRIAQKTVKCQRSSKPEDIIWNRLTCGSCGGRILRTGARVEQGKAQLRCKECGMTLAYGREELKNKIEAQIIKLCQPKETSCILSAEAIRAENIINRGLEQPDEPEKVLREILRGASVRFACCPEPKKDQNIETVDWREAKQWLREINLTENKEIHVKIERK